MACAHSNYRRVTAGQAVCVASCAGHACSSSGFCSLIADVQGYEDVPEEQCPDGPCGWLCDHKQGRMVAYHRCCLVYSSGQAQPARRLWAVARYNMLPSRGSTMAEERPMVRVMAGMIQSLYGLPWEICQLIAQYLPRFYSTAATLLCYPSAPKDIAVDLSRKVWARFIKLHGKAYLSSLSNDSHDWSEKTPGVCTVLIHSPGSSTSPSVPQHMYVAFDPWGVRRILFRQPMSVTQTTNIWWETMTIGLSGLLRAKTDVCFHFQSVSIA